MHNDFPAVGIDFGGTSIKSGLVKDGRIVRRGDAIDPQRCPNPDTLITALLDLVAEFRKETPDLGGVGIGLPGFVDSQNGIVHSLTNVNGWNDVPLCKIIEERSGLPAIIENDVNSMAYAEWKYGAAHGAQHALCLTLGTGVGGGLILNGRLYRGAQLAAGEIGHASIDYRGRPGPYGNFGCLEEYVGNQQITDRAVALYAAAGSPKPPNECTPRHLSEAAASGDPVATDLWATIGDEIGAALASAVWLLNPDTIVIGGGVAQAGELLFAPIRRSVASRTLRLFHEHLRILPATLGNDAGIIGNAALVLDSAAA
jgi:glucokinase